MRTIIKNSSKKVGLPPGSLKFIGELGQEKIRVTQIRFNSDFFEETELSSIEESFAPHENKCVTWINIDGLNDVSLMEAVKGHFDIHPLVLEDVVHTDQRTKFESYEHYLYLVLRMMSYEPQKQEIESEQLSILLLENIVITFQERVGDIFDHLRERLRVAKGRIRKSGADYLAYCLLDAVVDNYFVILEKIDEKVESIEEGLIAGADIKKLMTIHTMKREMIFMRKAVWPLREATNGLMKEESDLITQATEIYLRDVYDHTIHVIDTIESLRDTASGLLDIYMTSIGNKMNEVMKVLTIIATIFIPLTFIAGVYGMNFEFMPELKWKMGYFAVLGLMLFVALIMIMFFRKKKWI